jgi:acetyl esterase/lipase
MSARIDATTFDPELIEPATTEFNAGLVGGLAAVGWSFPPPSAQALRDGLRAAMPAAEPPPGAYTLDADGVPLVVVPSENPTAVFVHCHPGGWTIGSPEESYGTLSRIAAATGMTAVSIGYRLAPEHPYPAGPDDCERAVRWIAEHAESRFGSSRLLIGGESAGANLALVTLLRVPGVFAAASLLYGNYDLTMTPSQRHADSGVMITRGSLEWFYDQYVPDVARRGDPDISPLYADLTGLPPTLLSVGSADSLLDDTVFLAARMLASGVDVELQVVPGGEHGFDMGPVRSSTAAVATIDAFLARHATPAPVG